MRRKAVKIALDGFDEAEHLNYCDAIWTFTELLNILGFHVSKDEFKDPMLTAKDRKKIQDFLLVDEKSLEGKK
jgi:hypothetical protein